jgi:hypothetical protein
MGVLERFVELLPSQKTNVKGWIEFNCPYCGDTRGRGSFIVTDNNGFRYKCWNGGCIYAESPTGWEPESLLGGRCKLLFKLLGGNVRNLPIDHLYSFAGNKTGFNGKDDDIHSPRSDIYPEAALPKDAINILDADPNNVTPKLKDAIEYLMVRGEEIALSYNFMWSPENPDYLIIPFYHRNRVVGWYGRLTSDIKKSRFIGTCPADFIFRQDTIADDDRAIIVTEGIIDAIAVDAVGIRGSTLTKRQIEFLNDCGSIPIILPDLQTEGLSYVDIAKKNNWPVSIPEWDYNIKDAAQAVSKYGKLYTVESILAGATMNYNKAKMMLRLREIKI